MRSTAMRQYSKLKEKLRVNFSVESREFNGRASGVGYCEVGIGRMLAGATLML